MAEEIRINYENGEQGRAPVIYNQHLPSTELRGRFPGGRMGKRSTCAIIWTSLCAANG